MRIVSKTLPNPFNAQKGLSGKKINRLKDQADRVSKPTKTMRQNSKKMNMGIKTSKSQLVDSTLVDT